MNRPALIEPDSRRLFWITPRAARTVGTAGAATVFRGWGRNIQATATTANTNTEYTTHRPADSRGLTGCVGLLAGLSG
jgi:hypothetical protein